MPTWPQLPPMRLGFFAGTLASILDCSTQNGKRFALRNKAAPAKASEIRALCLPGCRAQPPPPPRGHRSRGHPRWTFLSHRGLGHRRRLLPVSRDGGLPRNGGLSHLPGILLRGALTKWKLPAQHHRHLQRRPRRAPWPPAYRGGATKLVLRRFVLSRVTFWMAEGLPEKSVFRTKRTCLFEVVTNLNAK